VLALAAIVVAIVVIASAGTTKPKSTAPPAGRRTAQLGPVPANRVTGAGTATVDLTGDVATVTVTTHGLLNGAPHAMHIHASGLGVCPPASAARPHNGHLAISTTDGIHFYGPPVTSLTTSGDTSPKSIVDFSRYPTTGAITYTRQITIPAPVAQFIRAGNAVIVVHGIDYNGNGIYDNVLDRSELNPALPGEATAPALCGTLQAGQAVAASQAPGPGRGHDPAHVVYTASLALTDGAPGTTGTGGPSLFCTLA
jgi:hypothetical protein